MTVTIPKTEDFLSSFNCGDLCDEIEQKIDNAADEGNPNVAQLRSELQNEIDSAKIQLLAVIASSLQKIAECLDGIETHGIPH